jgi:hypothetical protein
VKGRSDTAVKKVFTRPEVKREETCAFEDFSHQRRAVYRLSSWDIGAAYRDQVGEFRLLSIFYGRLQRNSPPFDRYCVEKRKYVNKYCTRIEIPQKPSKTNVQNPMTLYKVSFSKVWQFIKNKKKENMALYIVSAAEMSTNIFVCLFACLFLAA